MLLKTGVKRFFRALFLISGALFLGIMVFAAVVDVYVGVSAAGSVSGSIEDLPYNRCGLLLGTSRYRADGTANPFFENRLDAAAALYSSGRIDFIIATGDNSDKRYNEPKAMLAGLVERGVPSKKVFLDYAGFRTLDSIVRAREIFGQQSVTVISQKFHNERAVYIARHYGIDAAGYNAPDCDDSGWIKVRLREVLARFRAFIDLYVTDEQPRFLGGPVDVN